MQDKVVSYPEVDYLVFREKEVVFISLFTKNKKTQKIDTN